MKFFLLSIISFTFALSHMAAAETIQLSANQNWFAVLSGPSLQPGDEIVLAAGVYSSPRRLQISQRGTTDKPITIRAATDATVTFRRPDARQNSFNLAGCQYLVIQDIEITGGATGIRIGKNGDHIAKFITLQNLHIHHIDGVAVTANYPGETYEGMIFRGNHIHHTRGHGEAFYLGSNNKPDGTTNGYLFDSLIENNHIHDLKGRGVSQGDGIELKDGCYNNIVRGNIIHDTNYPGIIAYSSDGKKPNVIERNAIWNTGDHGIQCAADAIIRNNLIVNAKGDGIHCRNHQSAMVGNLRIVHNTILSPSAIRIVPDKDSHAPIVFANNAVGGTHRIPPTSSMITTAGNVFGVSEKFPSKTSKCVAAADPQYRAKDDFNGTRRGQSNDAGAFNYSSGGNPVALPKNIP